jgi:hypothetical protein
MPTTDFVNNRASTSSAKLVDTTTINDSTTDSSDVGINADSTMDVAITDRSASAVTGSNRSSIRDAVAGGSGSSVPGSRSDLTDHGILARDR